jgi:hypothetical protein
MRPLTVPIAVAMLVVTGCGGKGAKPVLRSEVLSVADNYVTTLAQSLDELRAETERPEVAIWALRSKIATAVASYTNATGRNVTVSAIEMLILARLNRIAVKEHWIPDLLGSVEGAACSTPTNAGKLVFGSWARPR